MLELCVQTIIYNINDHKTYMLKVKYFPNQYRNGNVFVKIKLILGEILIIWVKTEAKSSGPNKYLVTFAM